MADNERKKKRKKKDDYSQNRQGGDSSIQDYSMNNNNDMMDAFATKAREVFEYHYNRWVNKDVNVVDTVYQLKYQGNLNINSQRRQQAMDLFMAGENMKDMGSHVQSSAKNKIQERQLASKVAKEAPEAQHTVANKIASNKKNNDLIEDEDPNETQSNRNLRIKKNFSTRRKELAAINETVIQTRTASGSVPEAMLQSALQSLLSFYKDCSSLPVGSSLRDSMCGHIMKQLESPNLDEEMVFTLLGYDPDA